MKTVLIVLTTLTISLLFSGCTVADDDPAPQCSTKAITYKEFKENYKPFKRK